MAVRARVAKKARGARSATRASAALYEALRRQSVQETRSALLLGPDLGALGPHGAPALLIAVQSSPPYDFSRDSSPSVLSKAGPFAQLVEIVDLLLEHGADIQVLRPEVDSMLESMPLPFVAELVARGLDINWVGAFTPLASAARRGRLDIVQWLLSAGADPNVVPATGWTALAQATYGGYATCALALVEGGADIRRCSGPDWLVTIAARRGWSWLVRALAEQGADLDRVAELPRSTDGLALGTPLAQAAEAGHLEVVRVLLERGVRLDVFDASEKTPLQHATARGHERVAELLRTMGAQVDVVVPANRLLEIAVVQDDQSSAKRALALGADPGATCTHEEDGSIIEAAVRRGHRGLVRLMMRATSISNSSLLHLAAREGHHEIAADLISVGARVDARDVAGASPLHIAAGRGHIDVVLELIARGSSVDVVDGLGRTPLRQIVDDIVDGRTTDRSQEVGIIRALLAAGADARIAAPAAPPMSEVAARLPKSLAKLVGEAVERGPATPKKRRRRPSASEAARARAIARADAGMLGAVHADVERLTGGRIHDRGAGSGVLLVAGSEIDDQVLAIVQNELLLRGVLLVRYSLTSLAVFATTDPHDAMLIAGTNGANVGLDPDAVVELAAEMEALCPIQFTTIGFDRLGGVFRGEVRAPDKLARRLVEVCPDLADGESKMDARRLVALGIRAGWFHLWWD